jgi:4-amino-4-deoxy-L-arabinose transferase-like glycosyltransferase
VFFWNNLAGRFAQVDAPEALQYAAAHRNSPGKYLIELPVYLWPWTLLAVAAARRAWRQGAGDQSGGPPLRFATAAFLPTLAVLSLAATARNIYLAPALPGVALLLGGWVQGLTLSADAWDRRAVRATSLLVGLAALVCGAAALITGRDAWAGMAEPPAFVGICALGIAAALALCLLAWRDAGRGRAQQALFGLLLAYSALLVGPASQIYPRVDTWQDLPAIGAAMRRDAAGRPLILFAPDETTRAFVDMYTRTSVALIPVPVTADSTARLRDELAAAPQSLVVAQLPGRTSSRTLAEMAAALGRTARVPHDISTAELPHWASGLALRAAYRYELPNGRRYALLEATASR